MLIAHLPAGYIFTKMLQKKLKIDKYILIGLIASVLPDIDMLYFYLIDNRQHLHHNYWTHIPFCWLIIMIITLILLRIFKKKNYLIMATIFFSNIFLHLFLDTIVGKIAWLFPFAKKSYFLFEVSEFSYFWILNFIFHWTFMFEMALIIWAICLFKKNGKSFQKPQINIRNKIYKRVKRTIILVDSIIVISIFIFIGANKFIEYSSKNKIYNSLKTVPKNKVGLLLGTGKFTKKGWINLYYKHRIDAAAKLYKSGKIECILATGDNGTKFYDEPTVMKEDLIARGIPARHIYLDYAGFTTYDSIVRSKEIFGLNKFTIISQSFQNERAIFIADKLNINAVGFNATKVNYGFKMELRERISRIKMMLDLLLQKKPKFLGKKIMISEYYF